MTDPPYGLNFNGQAWDGGSLAERRGLPGLHPLRGPSSCGASSSPAATWRRSGPAAPSTALVAGIEDAGLEVRDQLLWLYGSGVPKSAACRRAGSALKPAYEPIVLARRPLDPATPRRSLANIARHGTGALNIDATRLVASEPPATTGTAGCWPANVALSHEPDCDGGLRPAACPAHRRIAARSATRMRRRSPGCSTPPRPARAEREAGLERLAATRSADLLRQWRRTAAPICIRRSSRSALMRWIVRLVVPPGGVVLDPFAGSGSTGIAAGAGGTPVRRHRARSRVRPRSREPASRTGRRRPRRMRPA